MQLHDLLDRSRRSAGRFKPLASLALAVVIGSALLASRPTAVAAQGGGVPALERRLAAAEAKVTTLEAGNSRQASEIAALQAALANEVTARLAAETTLQSNINAEAVARQAADTTLQTSMNAERAARQDADTQLQTSTDQSLATLDAESRARESADAALQNRAAALENKTQYVSVAGGNMFITGTNLHIRNGLGATNGNPSDPFSSDPASAQVNGKGNLIVGYNELNAVGSIEREGSHNLVIGIDHHYHSFGGLLAGQNNFLWAPYASVTGGFGNSVFGLQASITGGLGNQAHGKFSTVTAGSGNDAIGEASAVHGGNSNRAIGAVSAVHGGNTNRATGSAGSVLGGNNQTQSETWTVILNTEAGAVKVTGYK